MEVTFLGTGTSQGVPMIACECAVCRSDDPKNRRTRTSVHVEMDGFHIQVDSAQEFRLQCVANEIRWIDTVILTHGHADHILGMDDLRRFCDLRNYENLPVYSTVEGLTRVREIYPYAILDRPLVRGYPAFSLHEMPPILETPGGTVRSVLLPHGFIQVLGLVFEEKSSGRRFAYYTDCKRVPEEGLALAFEADVVVLDALRPEPHPSHMSIGEALSTAQAIGARKTYLTHMTHAIDYHDWEARLPSNVSLAYDGLRLKL